MRTSYQAIINNELDIKYNNDVKLFIYLMPHNSIELWIFLSVESSQDKCEPDEAN